MRYFHIKTNEWITSQELQKRLDKKFEFYCNECNKKIGNHISVLAEGIFCKKCQIKIIEEIKRVTK